MYMWATDLRVAANLSLFLWLPVADVMQPAHLAGAGLPGSPCPVAPPHRPPHPTPSRENTRSPPHRAVLLAGALPPLIIQGSPTRKKMFFPKKNGAVAERQLQRKQKSMWLEESHVHKLEVKQENLKEVNYNLSTIYFIWS